MIGSNEVEWKKYQSEQMYNAKNARLVQSGVDPNESFHFVRGGLLVGSVMAVIGAILYVVFT